MSNMRKSRFSRRISGQAMIEYVCTAGILIAIVAILSVFLYSYKEHTSRVMDLAASEYP